MGCPLSKDATLPPKTNDGTTTATGGSSSGLVDTSGQSIDVNVAAKGGSVTSEGNKSAPTFFKHLSTRLTSLGKNDSQKTRPIEQGLKTFSSELTEDEKKVLLANEIPASEIKKLSIGVDAGGMGIIHVAEWKGQKVAIKEASAHVISKEVEIYNRMKGCEGVIQFYGVTLPPGLDKMCIVTKYADKGSLTWHLKVEFQNLTWADKLQLASQISAGIARLHQAGIFHRDLHGGNILIDDKGNALLTDFGASTIMEERVAKNIHEYQIEEVPTEEGKSQFVSKRITGLGDEGKDKNNSNPLIGVMAYIAPERFRNPQYFDAKCDIYSLGVLLWELTSGCSACSKVPQDVHLAIAILNGRRELPVEGTPAEYKDLYERCWDSDPQKRPDLDEILETLAKVRASMTPEQLAETRVRNNTQYDSMASYDESLSIPRPTSDIQQHFLSE
ncbi:hypothetical protein BGZ51_004875 [Haplosporangium sp. Z 767]|nr:hypothetical protein BGZ51_004875 [Haplosporangium sp. Z 767]KAF9182469.1 hypothetical protein BGZ50_004898 [Haplosporangium sp. Z 11]